MNKIAIPAMMYASQCAMKDRTGAINGVSRCKTETGCNDMNAIRAAPRAMLKTEITMVLRLQRDISISWMRLSSSTESSLNFSPARYAPSSAVDGLLLWKKSLMLLSFIVI